MYIPSPMFMSLGQSNLGRKKQNAYKRHNKHHDTFCLWGRQMQGRGERNNQYCQYAQENLVPIIRPQKTARWQVGPVTDCHSSGLGAGTSQAWQCWLNQSPTVWGYSHFDVRGNKTKRPLWTQELLALLSTMKVGTDLTQLLAQTSQRESWLSLKAGFLPHAKTSKDCFLLGLSICLHNFAGMHTDCVQTLLPGSM